MTSADGGGGGSGVVSGSEYLGPGARPVPARKRYSSSFGHRYAPSVSGSAGSGPGSAGGGAPGSEGSGGSPASAVGRVVGGEGGVAREKKEGVSFIAFCFPFSSYVYFGHVRPDEARC